MLEDSDEAQAEAVTEINLLYEKISRVQYEVTWFPFKIGQLGLLAEAAPVDTTRVMIESMRTDINDFMDAAEAYALQAGHLLMNVERMLDEREDDEPEAA